MSVGHVTLEQASPDRSTVKAPISLRRPSSLDGHSTSSCKHVNSLHRRSMAYASSLSRLDFCIFEGGAGVLEVSASLAR